MLELAERIASEADALGIEIAIIGAMALAAHNYVRGTEDIDFATSVDPGVDLVRLERALAASGLQTKLNMPDADDPLGGLLRVWSRVDEEGDPIEPVDVINFWNPHQPAPNPGRDAVRESIKLDASSSLRYARLPELIALKLYAGSRRDQADVVEVLRCNPNADVEEIRTVCRRFGLDGQFEELLRESQE